MRRVLPWAISAILLIAFVASFSELERMRRRFGEVTQHTFHDHQEVRRAVIKAHLADASDLIVIVGDSITEMATFPGAIEGKKIVNAGIGGATIADYTALVPKIFSGSRPLLIVVAIGANDRGNPDKQKNLDRLLLELRRYAPVAVINPPDGETIDGIHPTRSASSRWVVSIEALIRSALN